MPFPFCTRQMPPFIVPVVIGFYYFGSQQPLSGLGVLANHHWFVCVPLPIARQGKLFCLFVCRGTLYCYGMGAFSLHIPYGMHLVVLTQLCFFWVVCHPNRTLLSKEPMQEPQNRYFLSPHRQTMPSYL